jgi:membrane-bound lytic murein transglycosylase A
LQGQFASVNWSELPGWSDDDLKNVWTTFLRNCQGLMRPTSTNLAGPTRATPRAWQPVCAAATDRARAPAANDAQAVRKFFQTWLSPWRLKGPDGKPASNIVTGYYEPLVLGSRTRTGAYQWPLYTVPADLLTIDLGRVYPELAGKRVRGKLEGKRVVPYESRAAIEASGRRPPAIVYVNDPVDNFFLQVQGSGRVQLPDGKTIRVAYADHNGHPYVSIGKWLADKGEMPIAQTSMQNIRAWAKRNPNRTQEMLNANPATVFFAEEAITDPEIGPKGAYGIPLMAQRSIAVDTNFVPLGTPVFLSTTMPASNTTLNRLVFAQDTGTAIRGAARTDFYWGFGAAAGELAGRMKQNGQMWVLWPKQAGAPSAR